MTRLTRAKQITRMSAVALGGIVVLLIVGKIGLGILNDLTVNKRKATGSDFIFSADTKNAEIILQKRFCQRTAYST